MQRQFDRGAFIYLIADSDFYESIDQYRPGPMYQEIVEKNIAGTGWRISHNGFWYSCGRPDEELPAQGWKIHVSARLDNAKKILDITSRICISEEITFKFAIDETVLALMNSKAWSRGGSGKYITIYPQTESRFIALLDRLYAKLKSFEGPYILSDKRYKDCKVLYYRYGGFIFESEMSYSGESLLHLRGPDGEKYQDTRNPFFSPPPWVQDPFPDPTPTAAEEEDVLLNDRFKVESALGFSNTGGVYKAEDIVTGNSVFIKEARSNLGFDGLGNDAIALLTKEYRLLNKVEPLGIAPKPVDSFWEWEHFYIVMEFIAGSPLTNYPAGSSIAIKQEVTEQQVREYIVDLKRLWLKIVDTLTALHENDIIFGDLSPNNLMFDPDSDTLKIIDFEGAHETGVDRPASLFTPGFASAAHRQTGAVAFANDYYSLGAVFLYTIVPINQVMDISPQSVREFLQEVTRDFDLPQEFMNTILRLLNNEIESLEQVKASIEAIGTKQPLTLPSQADPAPSLHRVSGLGPQLVRQMADYIHQVADHSRFDRLFPADTGVFAKNGLNIAYGAAGVFHAFKLLNTDMPSRWFDWFFARLREQECPPGLYMGYAGIAWVMQELGFEQMAGSLFRGTLRSPLIYKTADILYGASGWGMAALKLWFATKEELYLAQAQMVGDWLIETKQEQEESGNYHWTSPDGMTWLGYARGSSGIAMYLLNLYLATLEGKYLEAGKRALAFDLSYLNDSLGWLSIPECTERPGVVLPYWAYGSAGVGTTLLRYHAVTGEEEYAQTLAGLIKDASAKYTVFPGLAMGISGLGNFLVDCHQFLNSHDYVSRIQRNIEGLLLFKIVRENKTVTFPGNGLQRISTDFASGSSGIALYLNRVLTNAGNFNFMLDQLLAPKPVAAPVPSTLEFAREVAAAEGGTE